MEYYSTMARPRLPLPSGDQVSVIAPLARGFKVLSAFQLGDPPLRNQDIARRTGIPPSSVSRFTGSLVALGYLSYDPDNQTYSLAPSVLSFGQAFLGGIPLRYRLRPGMHDLADKFGAAVALGARNSLDMIYVECCKGQSPVPFRFDVGSSIPLLRSAMGWGYLAGLDQPAFERIMDEIMRADEDARPTLVRKIDQAREDVRTRGFCISMGTYESGVHTVGVPVFTRPGDMLYGLTCGAPAYHLSEEQLVNEIGPRLVWLARSVLQHEPPGADFSRSPA
jgi:DNA-binding IclR family transcriptional regulator